MEEKMSFKIQLLLAFLITVTAYAYHRESRIKIAILDSGADKDIIDSRYLCKSGHKSFFDSSPLEDLHRDKHGTNVYGLIAEEINFQTHCIIVVKVFDVGRSNTQKIIDGLEHAIDEDVKFINMSISSTEVYDPEEKQIIESALKAGIKISLAAGNNNKDLNQSCDIYPVCYAVSLKYDNFHIVGSYTHEVYKYSNYGDVVSHLEDGTNQGFNGLTGTSQATAVHTGKWTAQ